MIVMEDNFKSFLPYKTFVALGSFDGIHLGHTNLIHKNIELSKQYNAKSMIFTFKNHPLTTINKELAPKLIMDNETKLTVLQNMGIDIVNMSVFDEDFMKISPDEFVVSLIRHYNVIGIIAGFNYRFGYKNLGDIELLKKLSSQYGFSFICIPPVKYKGDVVSSSKIRNLISDEGDIKKANIMLTRPFMLKGSIIEGNKIGRTINFPTINLDYNKDCILPKGGVYYSNVKYNGILYKAITNVGFNPTVHNNKLSIETHILNFDKNIYGEYVTVYFIKKIRDEKKFNSLKELKYQLTADKKYADGQKINLQTCFNLL